MAKYCGKCGSQMPDQAIVCGNCGERFESVPVSQPVNQPVATGVGFGSFATTQFNDAVAGAKNGNKASMKKLGIIGVAVLLVVVILFSLIGGIFTGGPEKVIKNFFKNYEKNKPNSVIALFPDFMENDVDGEVEDDMDNFFDYIEDEYDTTKVKITYEIEDEEEIDDEDDLEEFADLLADEYDGVKESKVKGIIWYEIDVKVKCDGETEKVTLELCLIKYGSKWYVFMYEWY